MVKICNQPYNANEKYSQYFEMFSYELSDFQKYAIEAIVEGHHVLTTAHTGSGKTLSAEFAIQISMMLPMRCLVIFKCRLLHKIGRAHV